MNSNYESKNNSFFNYDNSYQFSQDKLNMNKIIDY